MIGNRIKQLRDSKGLSINALARDIGMSPGNISDIEKNKNTPATKAAIRIAEYFRCSLNWLLTGEGNKYLAKDIVTFQTKIAITEYKLQILQKYGHEFVLKLSEFISLLRTTDIKLTKDIEFKLVSIFDLFCDMTSNIDLDEGSSKLIGDGESFIMEQFNKDSFFVVDNAYFKMIAKKIMKQTNDNNKQSND